MKRPKDVIYYVYLIYYVRKAMKGFFMNWNSELTSVKGIGEKTVKLFQKLDIYTVRDLLYYFPKDYEKFEEPTTISACKSGGIVTIRTKIPNQNMEHRKVGRLVIFKFFLLEGNKKIDVTFFNMAFLKNTFFPGQEYIFRGKLEEKRGRLVMEQPKFYKPEEYVKYLHTLQPIYSLTKGLTSNFIQKAVKEILKNLPLEQELLPEDMVEKYDLYSRREAFELLHFPLRAEEVIEARKRLVFEEFLAFCLNVKSRKETDLNLPFDRPLVKTKETNRLLEQLPYKLTQAQQKAWSQIEEDMAGEYSMNRMVQGDVGSGKTILAFLALLMAAENQRQGALMAPTEVLAKQHYDSILELTEKYQLNIKPVLLVGSMTAKEKRRTYERIEMGLANVIIGTHALIQDNVNYNDLALVITDEQHRFGVRQRQKLQEKGDNTHILVMSATPIPRTLAIVLFGDLHLSILDEMPVGRIPIKNCVVNTSYREKAYQFMLKEIEAGHQVYCICPMVEEGEMDNLENVVGYAEKLQEYFGERAKVSYLHGKMRPALKNQIMEEFAAKNIDILVSTTVIEVGINVPNATVMMVENAERFGLAQLHQLRGRVGRGKDQSYCIFVNGNQSDKTSERLELLNKSNDGFFLANEDMRLRGPGDFFGIRQSGEFAFRIGDIYNDSELLLETAALADEILCTEEKDKLFPLLDTFQAEVGNEVDFRSI